MEHEKIDFLVFPHVEELDVIGPFEVFGKINDVTAHHCKLRILAPTDITVCTHGLHIVRTCSLTSNGGTILVVPGGKGAREPSKERSEVITFLRTAHTGYHFIVSVCTGAFLLHEAGLLTNKVCTTHTLFRKELRRKGCTVLPHRVVHDGTLITSAGVTSGIDASLYMVTVVFGINVAEKIIKRIEYLLSAEEIGKQVHIIP